MKSSQRILILGILILGSAFSGCTKQVEQTRILLGRVKAGEAKVTKVEAQLVEVLEAGEKYREEIIAKLDTNNDGLVTQEEMKNNKAGVLAIVMTTFKTGNWKEIAGVCVFLIFMFFGLHGADPLGKIRQYGTKGMLGWVFRIAGTLGKKPEAKPPVAPGPDA